MTSIPKISALFETSLASAMTAAATSFTLVSGTDRDGNALSGLYPFIIDEGTADEEFVVGTISGTNVTVTYRGCDADTPTTEVAANKKAHRRGASVKITDYPIMGYLRELLNGAFTFPNKLSYESHPTFSSNTEMVDKKYVDDTALAGAPDASTTVKGVAEEATQAEVDADTAAGGTSARLFVNPSTLATSKYGTRLPSSGEKSALAGTSGTPGSGNKYVTADDVAENTASKVVRRKSDSNVTVPSTPSASTDAASKSYVDAFNPSIAIGTGSRTAASGSGTQAITGFGFTPRVVEINATTSKASNIIAVSFGVKSGSSSRSVFSNNDGASPVSGESATNCITLKVNGDTDKWEGTMSLDADGITITWTKTGTPSTAYFTYKAFR